MFLVDDATAEQVRKAWIEQGERAAVMALREHYPGLHDNEHTLACARAIASWAPKPQPEAPQ